MDRGDLPAGILEAQIATDPGFLLRVYAEGALFLKQKRWQRDLRVAVICPSRMLNFGAPEPMREFLEHWVQ